MSRCRSIPRGASNHDTRTLLAEEALSIAKWWDMKDFHRRNMTMKMLQGCFTPTASGQWQAVLLNNNRGQACSLRVRRCKLDSCSVQRHTCTASNIM
jgi:hypothetical protein